MITIWRHKVYISYYKLNAWGARRWRSSEKRTETGTYKNKQYIEFCTCNSPRERERFGHGQKTKHVRKGANNTDHFDLFAYYIHLHIQFDYLLCCSAQQYAKKKLQCSCATKLRSPAPHRERLETIFFALGNCNSRNMWTNFMLRLNFIACFALRKKTTKESMTTYYVPDEI